MTSTEIGLLVLAWIVVMGGVGGALAKAKGIDLFTGYLAGWFLGPLGWLLIATWTSPRDRR